MTDADTNNTTPEPSLTARVVKGGAWVFAGRIAGRGLQLVKLVILARLLVPEDFGLFGIAMLGMAAIETFTKTGFDTALIQRRDDARAHLDTAWTVQIVRALGLAAILFAAAPLVAHFFEEPRAVPILRMLCLAKVIGGFRNVGIIYWRKEIEFHRQVVYGFATSFVSVAVGITFAFVLRNVWALVWASLAGAVARVVLSYAMHPYRPRLHWDSAQALELFGFGKWLLGGSIVSFLAMKADRIILGNLLGAAALGLYNMADRIGGLFPTEFMHLTNSVMMPAYAKVQDDTKRLGRAFLQVFRAAVYTGGPVAIFIIISAPELVQAVLGDAWMPAVIPLQILAAGAFLRCAVGVSAPVFLGTGHPHIQFWKSFIRAVVTLAVVYPLTIWFGPAGTAMSAVAGVIALSPLFFFATKIADVPLTRLGRAALPGLILTILVGLGALPGKMLAETPIISLGLQALGSGLLALASIYVLDRFQLGPPVLLSRYWRRFRSVTAPA